MPTVIDLQAMGDTPGTAAVVAESLVEGGLVGLPLDWSYGVAVLGNATRAPRPHGLSSKVFRTSPCVLAFRDVAAIHDLAGGLAVEAERLVRRCWPGVAVLEFGPSHTESPAHGLDDGVRRVAMREGRLRATVPSHPFVRELLSHLPGPLVFALPERESERHVTATDLGRRHADDLEILVDDGPVRYDHHATCVAVDGNRWWILEDGVPSTMAIQRMAGEIVLFVCTGNTCRSPMAEAIFRRRLAERLKCADDELIDHGFAVISAGLAAPEGAPANPEAVMLLEQHGLDLHGHESQPATRALLQQADRIITMTRGHRDTILAELPEAAPRIRLLLAEGRDISDPIGRGATEYRECFAQISQGVEVLVEEILQGQNEADGQ